MRALISLRTATAVVVLVLGTVFASAAVAADREETARQFVESMADQAIQALAVPDISRSERIRRFRALFNDHFAVEAIGKWVLGRYWSRVSPADQREYLRLFEDYIVASYVDRFAAYTGEKLRILKAVGAANEPVTVFSEIALPGQGAAPVRVDWRIEGTAPDFKVMDLVVEGISMSTTLRSDFGSIMRRSNGDIDGLLAVLRDKATSLQRDT